MATKYFTVNIPTTTHLKQFLYKRFGNPIALNNDTLLGCYLIGIMQKPNLHVPLKPQEKIYAYKVYNDEFKVMAPLSLMKDYNYTLTVDQAIQINRFYENLFQECLYIFCARRIAPDKREKGYFNAIYEFAELNNIIIGQHVSYDCLKKIEYRHRKKLEKKYFEGLSPQNSSVQYQLFV